MPQAEIGCLYEWDGIKHLVDTLSLSYHALAPDYEHNPELLADMAAEYIKTKNRCWRPSASTIPTIRVIPTDMTPRAITPLWRSSTCMW